MLSVPNWFIGLVIGAWGIWLVWYLETHKGEMKDHDTWDNRSLAGFLRDWWRTGRRVGGRRRGGR